MTGVKFDDQLRSPTALTRAFFERPTVEVAKDLLGKLLIRDHPEGRVALRLSEVEAYLGPNDQACHTFGGRQTDRVRTMWGEAGFAYVYLIYGIHHCLNVVTVGGGAGEAVLMRAGVAVDGEPLVRRRRGPRHAERNLLNGPGKLCQALAVDRQNDGCNLCAVKSGLWIGSDIYEVQSGSIMTSPRVGLGAVGDAAGWALNFSFRPPEI